jgi:hypothetical protein
MNDELDPQFRDLVLNDKKHLIVMRWIAQRNLCGQESIQLQIAGVIVITRQIGVNRFFELSFFHLSALNLVSGLAL